MSSNYFPIPPISNIVIRALDILFSSVGLVLASPLLIILSVLILIIDGAPFVFTQARSGAHERVFRIYKFRTLHMDESGNLKPTRLGPLLRKTSLDELPQLINILWGDMSFVGPRPLLPEYADFYRQHERDRFAVRPGLTGLAQIKGRNLLSWDEKLSADVAFVQKYSVGQYLRILLATPAVVVKRRGTAEKWDTEGRLDDERTRQVHSG